MDHLEGALKWWDSGMAVVPVVPDGSKRPYGNWKNYQEVRATREQVEQWFKTTPKFGVGIICGAVSGSLELLELEGRANSTENLDKIEEQCRQLGCAEDWHTIMNGYVEATPSGGIHILYRLEESEVPGNTKVARRPATADELAENPKDRVKVLAETRGEGGFVVVAPSSGTVHATGDSWSVLVGEVGMDVPVISRYARDSIIEAVHAALDEMPEVVREVPSAPRVSTGGTSPGDDYMNRTNWSDLLTSYGWTYASSRGGEQFWTRPGKAMRDARDHSATLYYQGSDNLYVFSSSTELPCEEPISKFAFYAFMEHRGDFSAAAKQLSRDGYGQRDTAEDWLAEVPYVSPGVGRVVDVEAAGVAEAAPSTSKKMRLNEWTETGVGELMADLYRGKFVEVPDQKAWRMYSEGLWVRDEGRAVREAGKRVTSWVLRKAKEYLSEAEKDEDEKEIKKAQAMLRKAESFRTDRGAKAVISRFSSEPGITQPFTAFDQDVNLIRFENGTLELDTMKLREHRPEDMITMNVPYAYDPKATAPRFRQAVEEWVPEETQDYLRRVSGYTLTGRPNQGAWFVLYGDTGCGKTTYLNIMNAALGDHARTAAQATFAQRNEGSRAANDLQDIRNARMVMISETKEGQMFNESLIKQYSGGDEMNSHGLYQENGTWKNRGVLFMATNHPPRLSADDNANWRRVKLIEFPNSLYTNPDRVPDERLAEEIIASELPGVMNWILEGMRDFRESGLNEPKLVTEAVRAHRVDVDPVSQFLNEGVQDGYIVIGEEAEISSTQVYQIFNRWCLDNGITPVGNRRFGMRLTAMRYGQRKGAQGARIRTGIGQGIRGVLGGIEPSGLFR